MQALPRLGKNGPANPYMIAITQPVTAKPPQFPAEISVQDWLDLLATGDCDQSAFLQSMQERFHLEPDGNWEVLSQLDQYYRRGKIQHDVFLALKTALAGRALGGVHDAAAPVAAPAGAPIAPEVKVGDRLRARYRIASILGRGGMGTVFEAIDDYRLDVAPSGQRLAVKVLHSALSSHGELLNELRREFQHLQLLSHPNIVRVFEFDRDGQLAFFTMELLNGMLLSSLIQSRKRVPLQRNQAFAVIRDVGAAIAHAHSRGVVHGDINPQNIFITTPGELRVLDFGASHRLIAGAVSPDAQTAPGGFATPGYASCQVLEGTRPDARDDVFALACVAYLLLCGRHPFPGCTALQARAAGLRARRPEKLKPRQWRALRNALRWDRESRPADVQEWLRRLDLHGAARSLPELTQLLDTAPPRPAKVGRYAALFGAFVLLAVGGYWIANMRQATPPVPDIPAPVARPAPAPEVVAASESVRAAQPAPRPAQRPPRPAQPPLAAMSPAPASLPARIDMAADTVEVAAASATAHVAVRRRDNFRGALGFSWWTESGTAKPGTDFVAVPPHVEHFENGKSSITLSIPVIETARAQSRSFYVVIDQPEAGAKLGARALTMITLPATAQ
jgi:eukaryotic-like serine/threonine-protein kinase